MLYKFIVWACWAKTQSYIRSNPNLVLTTLLLQLCHVVNHNLSYKIVEKKNCDKRCSPKISLTLVNTNRQYKD